MVSSWIIKKKCDKMRHADDNIRYIQLIPSRVKVHSDVVVTHTQTLAFRMALFQSITTSRPQPKGPTYHFNSFLSLSHSVTTTTTTNTTGWVTLSSNGRNAYAVTRTVNMMYTASFHPRPSTSHSRPSSLVVTANNRPYLHRRHLETRTRPRGLVQWLQKHTGTKLSRTGFSSHTSFSHSFHSYLPIQSGQLQKN